jgi:hypothetical protein
MRFLMFVCSDTVPVEAPTTPVPDIEEWVSKLEARGIRITGDPLAHQSKAATVRVRGGRTVVTDGPFIETKEQMGGIVLMEVRDLDEAMAWAERCPGSYAIEIRPVMDYEAYARRAASAEGAAS